MKIYYREVFMHKAVFLSFFAFTCTWTITGQQKDEPVEVKSSILNNYETNSANVFGSKNPEAAPEASQFDFMIGTFDCDDEIRNPADGKRYRSKSVWSTAYFLNGFGVQDKYWSPFTVSSSTRLFDTKKGKWIVTYFQSQPVYLTGVWEGQKEGEKMIMRQQNGSVESRLTFSNISKNGFDWIGERVEGEQISSGWNISCKRRK